MGLLVELQYRVAHLVVDNLLLTNSKFRHIYKNATPNLKSTKVVHDQMVHPVK